MRKHFMALAAFCAQVRGSCDFNTEEMTVQQDNTAGPGPRGLQGRLLAGTQVGLSLFVFECVCQKLSQGWNAFLKDSLHRIFYRVKPCRRKKNNPFFF